MRARPVRARGAHDRSFPAMDVKPEAPAEAGQGTEEALENHEASEANEANEANEKAKKEEQEVKKVPPGK